MYNLIQNISVFEIWFDLKVGENVVKTTPQPSFTVVWVWSVRLGGGREPVCPATVLMSWHSHFIFRPLFSQHQCDSPTGYPVNRRHVSNTCWAHVIGDLQLHSLMRILDRVAPPISLINPLSFGWINTLSASFKCIIIIFTRVPRTWYQLGLANILQCCSCFPAVKLSRVPLYKLFNLACEVWSTMHFGIRS